MRQDIYDEVNLESVRKNNDWFIRLRWLAAISIILLILVSDQYLKIEITSTQFIVLTLSAVLILCYNLIFLHVQKSPKYSNKSLNIAAAQIIADLLFLSLIIYYTGGVESPLVLFYLFHIIIGSIILPKRIMLTITVIVIVFLSLFSFLEYIGLIAHQKYFEFLMPSIYKDKTFIIGTLLLISFTFITVYMITSKIAGELKLRERELLKARDEIASAEKSKQRFMIAVVHELKSPIAAALSNIQLVLGNYVGSITEQTKEKLERSKKRLEESINTINSVIKFSQFKLTRHITKESLNIPELILKIFDNLSPIIENKNMSKHYDFQTVKNIEADPFLIELVLSNIIGNSIKYTNSNGQVDVIVKSYDNLLEVSVSDDGIGIPQKDLQYIFNENYRAENASKIEGTGTGLAIAKQVVESHNGTISIKSPSDKRNSTNPGTTVVIQLPY